MYCDDIDLISKIIDSLFVAKRAIQIMPELPKDMKPSHMRVLNVIYKNHKESELVRVTDVSNELKITKPSITKLINELINLGAVNKSVSNVDKRVALVELTLFGKECVEKYILDYHEKLADKFFKIDKEKYVSLIETIGFIYESMEEASKEEL